jgi:PAS domain-containing protein
MRYRANDAKWRTLRVYYRSGRKLASGLYEMFGLTQDVTELAQARDNADLISGRLELAMAAAKAGVYEIDLKSGDRWSSEQFKTLAGPEAMARQALNPFGIYTEDQQDAVRKSWERCLVSNDVESMDTRIHTPDGKGRWVRLFTRVQRNAAGEKCARCRPDARHRRAQAAGTRSYRGQAAGRGGDCGEIELPRCHESRDPHAAQRHPRHGAGAVQRSLDR